MDKDGYFVAEYVYDAWGKLLLMKDGDGNNISNNTSHIGYINPIRYRSYYYDVETKLYYLESRYYDPETGRFIQPSDVSSLKLFSISGLNLYSYTNNNPISSAYSSSSTDGMVDPFVLGGVISVGNSLGYSNSFGVFAGLNWSQVNAENLAKDVFISLGEVASRIIWGLSESGRDFFDFHHSAYGISGYSALDNLPSKSAKIFKNIGRCLMVIDVLEAGYYSYQSSHSFGQASLSVGLTAGKNYLVYKASVGMAAAFGTWTGTKLGSSLGLVAGPVGFAVGAIAGAAVGWLIDGIGDVIIDWIVSWFD